MPMTGSVDLKICRRAQSDSCYVSILKLLLECVNLLADGESD